MFLTEEELVELTGYSQKEPQIRILVANGIKHTIKRNGRPCVARSTITGQKTEQVDTAPGGWKPRKAS